MTQFKRDILPDSATKTVCDCLQQNLVDLIDLALQLKQAHWCVVGAHFRALHLQLDEIIEDVRNSSDEVAERMSMLGIAPDGLVGTVADQSSLKPMQVQFQQVPETVTVVADRLLTTIQGLRKSIEATGDVDPITEDLLIGISAVLEKHLWMVQAQEE